MTDPHTVSFVLANTEGVKKRAWSKSECPETDNPYVQRAGTWTLFRHVNNWIERYGEGYEIIGIQSCGDLTMNPYHVAFIRDNRNGKQQFCRLETAGDPQAIQEKIHERSYRCLVKWSRRVRARGCLYEFLDLVFQDVGGGRWAVRIDDLKDISKQIDFALSGKPVVQRGQAIALANVIDQFQDVRHVFSLPTVPAAGAKGPVPIREINFGEYTLFNDLNARRGALNSPIIVDLIIPDAAGGGAHVRFEDLVEVLGEKHYRPSLHSPTRRGEYRKYSKKAVEIFYPHNVYPFGVLGGKANELVGLASGGLSGRVGNTLQGITRIMYDFFGCEDALVLDEGYDTFHIINPNSKGARDDPDHYKYDNAGVLKQVAQFTAWRIRQDSAECREMAPEYKFGPEMKEWPLNKKLFADFEEFCVKNRINWKPPSDLDCFAVEPRRSQVRAILVFARRKQGRGEKKTSVTRQRVKAETPKKPRKAAANL